MLMVIFLISIAVLLFCIIKLKLNAFVALLVTAYGTGIACMMPLADVSDVVTNKFGSTLGGIGIVTGLGVMLGMFMYESGGIDNIANGILKALGDEKSQFAVAVSGFITGIPVFGDVVYSYYMYICPGSSDGTASCSCREYGHQCRYLLLLRTDLRICRYVHRRYHLRRFP